MPRIIDRNKQIPGGYKFYLPQTKWSPRPWASFNEIVETLFAHLQGNPVVLQQLGWPLDKKFLEGRVDDFNARLCQQMGWTDYFVADGGQPEAAPFPQPPVNLSGVLQKVAAGGDTLVHWIASGAEAVNRELAEHRAGVCERCPRNNSGGFETWFTVPVSNAIRKALVDKDGLNLHTTKDAKLGVCSACLCPLKLKVWIPIADIAKRMPEESRQGLISDCWIRMEMGPR